MCEVHEKTIALCEKARAAGRETASKGLNPGAIAHAMELAMEEGGEIVSCAVRAALEREAKTFFQDQRAAA